MSLEDLRSVKNVLRGQLLQLGLGGNVVAMRATNSVNAAVSRAGRNVHAVGIGRKLTEGSESNEMCVRIYVVQKLPQSLMSPRDVIPAEIDGIPTDIIEAEPSFILAKKRKKTASKKKATPKKKAAAATPACSTNRRRRQRPVVAGISAGHHDITAGTLGCFCRSIRPGDDPSTVLALSNNHVFADVNQAMIGDPLFQPGPLDGGVMTDQFARLERFVRIQLGGTIANRVDAAIGSLVKGVSHDPSVCSIGSITGIIEAEEEMAVRKHGRTTGFTEGKIDDIEHDVIVGMDHNDPTVVALFENQLRLVSTTGRPIGLGGDSGSVVVHGTQNRVVGLYFAGPQNGMSGIANRIQDVISCLEIELI